MAIYVELVVEFAALVESVPFKLDHPMTVTAASEVLLDVEFVAMDETLVEAVAVSLVEVVDVTLAEAL